jgi:hypothetical protein
MLSHIDKLVKYEKQVKELNELNKKISGQESYDTVEITISPDVLINVRWQNKEGKFSATKQFPFSVVEDIGERTRKQIEYRKEKLGENANLDGESSEEADV